MTKSIATRGRSSLARALGIGALSAAAALLPLSLFNVPAATATATTHGDWSSYPAQTYTDDSVTAPGATVYETAVRAPINPDNTSNFSAKRGVIPVQFDLSSATSTVTTVTRTYDPPVWESIGSNDDPAVPASFDDNVSYATFTPATSMTFADVTNLSATYLFTTGDCAGGSLRWTIDFGPGQPQLYAYYGTPNGPDQGCSGTSSGSGDNLITTGITPDRFEVQGVSSPVYTDYASVAAIVGTRPISWISLQLDSGWKLDQRANVSDVTVNDNTWVPLTSKVISTDTVNGTFTKTCTLPTAMLKVFKTSGTPTGQVNEPISVQPKDTDGTFRQVDCKYIYNLDVSSLFGAGTYSVFANINGTDVQSPAVFDLR